MKDINKQIDILLAEQGLQKKDLARLTGQSPSNLCQKLKREDIRLSELKQIAEALGVQVQVTFTK